MSHRRTVALTASLALVALTAPATAGAATLAPLKGCYVSVPNAQRQVELVTLQASGFTPGTQVDVSVDSTVVVSSVPVDAAGNVAPQVPAPFIESGERDFVVTATQRDNPAITVSAKSRVTALRATFSPLSGRPGRKVTFRGQGFTLEDKPLYLHYRYRGKTRRTLKVTPKGPCGTFSVRRRLFPFSSVGAGRWTIQFDQQKRYSRTPRSSVVRQAVDVSRRVRRS